MCLLLGYLTSERHCTLYFSDVHNYDFICLVILTGSAGDRTQGLGCATELYPALFDFFIIYLRIYLFVFEIESSYAILFVLELTLRSNWP